MQQHLVFGLTLTIPIFLEVGFFPLMLVMKTPGFLATGMQKVGWPKGPAYRYYPT